MRLFTAGSAVEFFFGQNAFFGVDGWDIELFSVEEEASHSDKKL